MTDVVMGDASSKKELPQIQVDASFNLRNYIKPYKGHMRIHRLLFIADRAKELRKEAFKIILEGKKFLQLIIFFALFFG